MAAGSFRASTQPRYAVAVYRVASAEQGHSGLGFEAQQVNVRDSVEREGWMLVAEHRDIASGTGGRHTGFQATLTQCRQLGAVLVLARLDRITRRDHTLSGVLEEGISIRAAAMPGADGNTLDPHDCCAGAGSRGSVKTRLVISRQRAVPWQEDPVLTKLSRRAAVALATGASVHAGQGLAQDGSDFPSRPLRLVVPYAPGGTSDTLARLIAGPMQALLRQTVIVENRPGAGSLLGTEAVVRAPADGYTLLLADTPLTTVPAMQVAAGRTAPYDPTRDLTSILHLASAPVVMFTSASLPMGNVQEFFARALASPDTMSIASSGVGSTTHLIAELAIRQSGARIAHIPYRGGGPALQDVAAGNVQATFLAWASGAALVQSGQVRAIGIATERRMPDLPEVPTLREQGLEIVASFWWGLMGPPGIPLTVQQRLAQAADAALRTSELTTRLATLGLERDIRDAEAFKTQIGQEMQRWGGVISAAGIRAD